VLTPTDKGAIAEAVIAAEAVKAGVRVWRPMSEGGRADLVFEIRGRFLRIQCKWARRAGDVVVVSTKTSRLTPAGYVRTRYSPDEVDAIAAYCADTEVCYFIPIAEVGSRHAMYLRLAPARNNQEFAISYAANYEFSGALAQLGERRAGSAKVAGSSPACSTR
jgi:PD-(D/E)XK endonuclease